VGFDKVIFLGSPLFILGCFSESLDGSLHGFRVSYDLI